MFSDKEQLISCLFCHVDASHILRAVRNKQVIRDVQYIMFNECRRLGLGMRRDSDVLLFVSLYGLRLQQLYGAIVLIPVNTSYCVTYMDQR